MNVILLISVRMMHPFLLVAALLFTPRESDAYSVDTCKNLQGKASAVCYTLRKLAHAINRDFLSFKN